MKGLVTASLDGRRDKTVDTFKSANDMMIMHRMLGEFVDKAIQVSFMNQCYIKNESTRLVHLEPT